VKKQLGQDHRDKGSGDMAIEQDGEAPDSGRGFLVNVAGMVMLRATLLFGSAAMALALILTPIADRFSRDPNIGAALDYMATGSIERSGNYTIRRSVLQKDPSSVCIVRPDGRHSGDC
jgi:hypothetical protein